MLLPQHQKLYHTSCQNLQFDKGVFFETLFLERNDDIWQEETQTATAA